MKKVSICSIIILLIFVILNMSYTVYGAEIQVVDSVRVATKAELINPDDYEPGGIDEALSEAGRVTDFASTIIAVIRTIGIIVTVITLMIMGIKYMTADPSGKADVKQKLIGLVVATVVIFGGVGIFTLVVNLMNGILA